MSHPIEIERKYVIAMPDIGLIELQDSYTVSDILQTYLESEPGITHRVRARSYKDATLYTETKKMRIDKISSFEDERQISEDEYVRLLERIKAGTHTLRKTRHTFLYLGQMFEVDIYPEWQRSCIMETELDSPGKEVLMPQFISVIAEVSGDKRYSNASMSYEFPEELV